MGTRCDLYVEKKEGDYIGIQCFYDGYPENMLQQLDCCNYENLYDYIIIGGSHGGFRFFSPSDDSSEFAEEQPNYIYDPKSRESQADYIYIVRPDGSVLWRKHSAEDWNRLDAV